MRTFFLTAALICTAGTASALCEDAWYLRNLAFDRAGYCFGSSLGKSVFSADCSTKSPRLTDWDQRMVSAHKKLEARYSCKINTKDRRLAASLIGKLEDVDLLPTLSEFESSCVGYTGAPVTMTSGIGMRDSYPTGIIASGETVHFRFEPWGGFEFVETDSGAGWVPEGSITPNTCEVFAG
ncbi:DUF4453 domain-containing protein [Shimia marina]|uniref:YARHG domain-containing protein n=1 Tax=Shimia marina TaxID=321267 RepID=A0A0P1ERS7_9RHOB|nr:DUF4453 domain-containing protein [Shimia marina]CUH53057.1 hypothetical protein SHM7688_02509 [Shimia marina]SFD93368.1 YARHG domain-containing protein [Shimia marina]